MKIDIVEIRKPARDCGNGGDLSCATIRVMVNGEPYSRMLSCGLFREDGEEIDAFHARLRQCLAEHVAKAVAAGFIETVEVTECTETIDAASA